MQLLEKGMIDDYLEWYIEKEFILDMEDAGWLTLKADKIKRGWSDQLLFGPGPRTVVVEFKRFGAKARRGEKLQDHFRNCFSKMGFEVHKITGKEEADALKSKLLA